MKHIKHHPLNDKTQKLSKDMKKQDLIKPKKDKKLPLEDSLSDPIVSKRVSKPSTKKKLSSEKHLSDAGGKIKKFNENAEPWKEGVLKVTYNVVHEDMSDEEYENAPDKEFIVTREMIEYILEQNVECDRDGGDELANIYMDRI